MALGFNPFLDISCEIVINKRLRPARPEIGQDFRNHSANRRRLFEHCDWPVILLDNDLNALLHLSKHSMKIPSHFGLAHVYGCHSSHYVPFVDFASAPALAALALLQRSHPANIFYSPHSKRLHPRNYPQSFPRHANVFPVAQLRQPLMFDREDYPHA